MKFLHITYHLTTQYANYLTMLYLISYYLYFIKYHILLSNTTKHLKGPYYKKVIILFSISFHLFKLQVSDDHDSREKIVSLSSVVITDIDTVAQILKMVLRDLPEPVITFATFESMMNICVQFEVKKCEIDSRIYLPLYI